MFKDGVLKNKIIQNDIVNILEGHIKRKSSKNIIKQMLGMKGNYFSLYLDNNKFLIEFSIYSSNIDYYILIFRLWKFDKRNKYYRDSPICLAEYEVGFTESLKTVDKPYKHSDTFDSLEDSCMIWGRLV